MAKKISDYDPLDVSNLTVPAAGDLFIGVDVSDTGTGLDKDASGKTVKFQYQEILGFTGWGDYVDGQYTSGSPFAIAALTDTLLPNNAATRREQDVPLDADATHGLYNSSTGKILTPSAGDGMIITCEAFIDRQSGNGAFNLTTWFDIGGSIPDLYKRTIGLKGSGAQSITWTTAVYCLDTWLANGAEVYVNSEVAINVYGIRFIVHRIHKGRGTYP